MTQGSIARRLWPNWGRAKRAESAPVLPRAMPARLEFDAVGRRLLALNRLLRPYDGWLAAGLLVLNLMVVVWSVESAQWVATPSLPFVLLLAALCGLVIARLPVWGALALPLGLAAGLVVVVWQLVSFQSEEVAVADWPELAHRLGLWVEAARDGAISIDPIPFAFALLVLTWLTGLLGAWMFVRLRHFWGVFILGGAGIFSNLTYLPPNTNVLLWFYLFTALVLVARVQSVRRRKRWQERKLAYDGHLGILSLTDSALVAGAVLLLAFLVIPKGGQWGPTNAVYEGLRTPLASYEEDFNRLFAGLPARRALGYRIWGDTMPFQGTINPTTVPVLQVQTEAPMHLKARTYDTYTSKGWISQGTKMVGLDWTPAYSHSNSYLARVEVDYVVYPNYSSNRMFASGRIMGSSRDVQIETYDSPLYVLNLRDASKFDDLPPLLELTARKSSELNAATGGDATDSAIAAVLPAQLKLLEVRRDNGAPVELLVAEEISATPDVVSVRSASGRVDAGEGYRVRSSLSLASPDTLRGAGSGYPTWALVKYTQLPQDFPDRIRHLASGITAPYDNPYDKAKAIETYLRGMTYDLEIEPPPYGSDGVEHFLFRAGKGYSEYFGSAMAVMLRSVDIPARMVTGYSAGEKIPGEDVYVIRDDHSHGWVEVFFPGFGWIPFEPTPGIHLPQVYAPDPSERPVVVVNTVDEELLTICEEDIEECETEDLPGSLAETEDSPTWGDRLRGASPWLWSALAALAVLAGIARIFWWRYMEPTRDPETMFRNLGFLGTLNSVGPREYETPYQFEQRLKEALPGHEGRISTVVGHYVQRRYGRKELTLEQTDELVEAWLSLRMQLLLRVFRPRHPQRSA